MTKNKILTAFFIMSASAVAADSMLVKSWNHEGYQMCKYSNGSVINNGLRFCDRTLKTSKSAEKPRLLAHTQAQIDRNNTKREEIKIQHQRKVLADWTASNYGAKGEKLRPLIMTGAIDASNIMNFLQ